jgi:deoxyribodipyrimidine photo-lyase
MQSALMWFRRDLRLDDNAALYHALRQAERVICAFIFDRAILDPLLAAGRQQDRRAEFIHAAVTELDVALRAHGSALVVRHANATDAIAELAQEFNAEAVFANHDYEPYARERDGQIAQRLQAQGRTLHTFKDQVIFERDEVLTGAGKPFTVFTPYKNAWLKKVNAFYLSAYDVARQAAKLAPLPPRPLPSLKELGFARTNLTELPIPLGAAGGAQLFDAFKARIDEYEATRNFPAIRGPSYLSVHLRFGTVSVRRLARFAWERSQSGSQGAATWLSELIWRDFYHQVLWHRPDVVTHAFRPEYDRIRWHDDEALLTAWCEGRTGYPLVDAAMLQLNQSGYMHNRLRMVAASFLTKDLGIDYRKGEAYFALHLNDFDLASNNGGWQWAASSGCDAQPYFRIFNPVTQSEKFDPEGKFIKRYLPQLANFSPKEIHAPWLVPPERQREAGCIVGTDYPAPIVDHAQARVATLARYAVVKSAGTLQAGTEA